MIRIYCVASVLILCELLTCQEAWPDRPMSETDLRPILDGALSSSGELSLNRVDIIDTDGVDWLIGAESLYRIQFQNRVNGIEDHIVLVVLRIGGIVDTTGLPVEDGRVADRNWTVSPIRTDGNGYVLLAFYASKSENGRVFVQALEEFGSAD